jgi:hypothetical protein
VRAEPELRDVGLADGQRARASQPFHGHRIDRRDVVAVDARPARRDEAAGVLQVLEGDGQPVKRAGCGACRQLGVGLVRERQARLVGELGHDGVDLGVHAGDLGQEGGHHLARGHLAAGNLAGERAGARETQGGHHACAEYPV